MGRDVRLRVSILVVVDDPMTEIQHVLRLEALLLTFPENTPLSGLQREPGAALKSTVQCIVKVNREHMWRLFVNWHSTTINTTITTTIATTIAPRVWVGQKVWT